MNEETADNCLNDAFLHSNLEYLAALQPPQIAPSLPLLPGGSGLLPADFQLASPVQSNGSSNCLQASIVLQVNTVEDISLPLVQRLRAMAPPEAVAGSGQDDRPEHGSLEETLRAMESDDHSSQHRGRRQRLLRLTLTDGFTRVIALEDCRKGCDALRNGVAWGAKLRLSTPLQVRHGVIILTSDKTMLLGGHVAELREFWMKYATEKLREMSGRPIRRVPANGTTSPRSPSPPPQPSSPTLLNPPRSVAPKIAPTGAYSTPAVAQTATWTDQRQSEQEAPPLPSAVANKLPSSQVPPPHAPTQPLALEGSVIGIIAEVTSELTVREGAACAANEPPSYSLLVSLAPPPTQGNDNSEEGLVVDLGHTWLQQAIGMDVESFRALSMSTAPNDVARLHALVEFVGSTLENFGVAEFFLRRRTVDGVVEVARVRQLPSQKGS
ncbi:putative RecQ mediated genome instability protein [Trypanosoma vivax]|uniref:RecQ-mediated genome instability protein 1 n=1 Tax=Trypanosoma vivax (strain Y486) TaxID=1055687 RepID=G0TSJ3_TRYVY|nr:hypothetical protein TRVL_03965 [Trypanosoma vivax]KAH8605587.1 putative RecQ mediated genome instability protein [Trypanosoma vivax]CCC46920.1 conserved hypothetical protein [Trypanosoma vivax Y486]